MCSPPPPERVAALLPLLLGLALFLGAWGLLHTGPWQEGLLVDTPVYKRYGDAVVRGEVPYRDVPIEYPPLALPAFAAPSALAGAGAPQDAYDDVFDGLMLACGLGCVTLAWASLRMLRATPRRSAAALALVGASPLLLGPLVLTRYDLWPAVLAAGALAALLRGRDRLGAGVLGAAIAAKAYPLVLVPPALAWARRGGDRRRAVEAAAVLAAVVAACVLPFVAVAPAGVAASVREQLGRPLQIESLPAPALLLLLGDDAETVSSHGSQNLGGRAAGAAAAVLPLLALAALAAVWLRSARGPADGELLVRDAAAAAAAVVVLGKVLSPQFLLWLVPLVPLVRGRRGLAASVLLAAALVLTQLWFPTRYWEYARDHDAGVAVLVLARNAVLAGLLLVLLWPARAAASARGPAAG